MNNQLSYRHRLPSLFGTFPVNFSELLDGFHADTAEQSGWFAPLTNVAETKDCYEISLDAPGMQSDDFDIELKEGQLLITGERKQESEQEEKTWHRVERHYGKFRRVFTLGNDIDAAGVDAKYTDGVLLVVVPKVPEPQAKKIAVKSS